MTTETTTIRADTTLLSDLDDWARGHDLSRTAAIHILLRVGMRALESPAISSEQIERLIADE